MSSTHQPALLVTGASGHMGRRVLDLLLEAQAGPVIAVTRTPDKLADFAGRGVSVRHGDFDDPASLPAAFAGADRLLLISTDAVVEPGRRLKQHRAAIQAAEAAGVGHVLYTSITNASPDSPVQLTPQHFGTEEALRDSSMGWTILRNNVYTDTLVGTFSRAIQMGTLFHACGDGKTAYITREDCAHAAAAALADGFTGQRTLDITGPQALSQADLTQIASTLAGKPIDCVALDLEVVIENMVNAGLPRPAAEMFASFNTGIAQGVFSEVTDTFETLTGQTPMRVAEFMAGQRDALLNGPPLG
ncbi:MAG: SDR family oxidoreductase [Anaerolineae bacterium]|nr:SDR family oxidoreductase [Anaerolineae bacterium]